MSESHSSPSEPIEPASASPPPAPAVEPAPLPQASLTPSHQISPPPDQPKAATAAGPAEPPPPTPLVQHVGMMAPLFAAAVPDEHTPADRIKALQAKAYEFEQGNPVQAEIINVLARAFPHETGPLRAALGIA
jgi:hypothetical protein